MRLADNVRIEPLFACTNIVIPIRNEDRQEAIAFWSSLRTGKGEEVEITIKSKNEIERREG